jgi:dienelactone hydrolase
MRWLLALIVQFTSLAAMAQDTVHFPSFDAGDGRPATELTAYLFKPNRPGPAPAVVVLHGCGGLISSLSHRIMSREVDWAGKLTAQGYAVLMIDSFTPRSSGEECSRSGFKEWVYLASGMAGRRRSRAPTSARRSPSIPARAASSAWAATGRRRSRCWS